MLAEVDPGLNPLYEGCKRNRDNWDKLQEEHDQLSKFALLRMITVTRREPSPSRMLF